MRRRAVGPPYCKIFAPQTHITPQNRHIYYKRQLHSLFTAAFFYKFFHYFLPQVSCVHSECPLSIPRPSGGALKNVIKLKANNSQLSFISSLSPVWSFLRPRTIPRRRTHPHRSIFLSLTETGFSSAVQTNVDAVQSLFQHKIVQAEPL